MGTETEQHLTFAEAEAAGWFNGPPDAVGEIDFDEDNIAGCTVDARDQAC